MTFANVLNFGLYLLAGIGGCCILLLMVDWLVKRRRSRKYTNGAAEAPKWSVVSKKLEHEVYEKLLFELTTDVDNFTQRLNNIKSVNTSVPCWNKYLNLTNALDIKTSTDIIHKLVQTVVDRGYDCCAVLANAGKDERTYELIISPHYVIKDIVRTGDSSTIDAHGVSCDVVYGEPYDEYKISPMLYVILMCAQHEQKPYVDHATLLNVSMWMHANFSDLFVFPTLDTKEIESIYTALPDVVQPIRMSNTPNAVEITEELCACDNIAVNLPLFIKFKILEAIEDANKRPSEM